MPTALTFFCSYRSKQHFRWQSEFISNSDLAGKGFVFFHSSCPWTGSISDKNKVALALCPSHRNSYILSEEQCKVLQCYLNTNRLERLPFTINRPLYIFISPESATSLPALRWLQILHYLLLGILVDACIITFPFLDVLPLLSRQVTLHWECRGKPDSIY